MTKSLRWYPIGGGTPLVLDTSGPYFWRDWSGWAETLVTPLSHKGPGQVGETLVDFDVAPRVLPIQATVVGDTRDEYLANIRTLASKLVAEPLAHDEEPAAGLLQYLVDGTPLVELPAVPRGGPHVVHRGPHFGRVDIEFFCPNPFWRKPADTSAEFDTSGTGAEYPFDYPHEYVFRLLQANVTNEGDVSVPVMMRVYGELTTPRIMNITTGRNLKLVGAIPTGQYLEIDTTPGRKRVELVTISTGARVNAMDRLDLDEADFWTLAKGVNNIRFEADVNVDGTAALFWRPAYAAPPVVP